MVKVAITIKISPELAAHIEHHKKVYPDFSVSPWVEQKYREEFMMQDVIKAKIAELQEREEVIKAEKQRLLDRIKYHEEQEKAQTDKLTKDARKFLKDVPQSMENGFKGKALYRNFTSTFKVNVDYNGFLTLVATESKVPLEDLMLING